MQHRTTVSSVSRRIDSLIILVFVSQACQATATDFGDGGYLNSRNISYINEIVMQLIIFIEEEKGKKGSPA